MRPRSPPAPRARRRGPRQGRSRTARCRRTRSSLPSPRAAASIASVGPDGHALVAPGPVDDVRPDADRRDAVLVPEHARRALVGELVDAVERRRSGAAGFRSGRGVGCVVDGSRARVRETGDPLQPGLDGLEDHDRPEDVHVCASHRVRAAERHLERREMDDPRDLVLVERAADRASVGDVAATRASRGRARRRRGRARSRASSSPRS